MTYNHNTYNTYNNNNITYANSPAHYLNDADSFFGLALSRKASFDSFFANPLGDANNHLDDNFAGEQNPLFNILLMGQNGLPQPVTAQLDFSAQQPKPAPDAIDVDFEEPFFFASISQNGGVVGDGDNESSTRRPANSDSQQGAAPAAASGLLAVAPAATPIAPAARTQAVILEEAKGCVNGVQ